MTDLPQELGFKLEANQFASGQCLHPRRWKFGFQRNGKQRLRCVSCGASITDGIKVPRLPIDQRVTAILPFYKQKFSRSETARALRISDSTVGRIFRVIDKYLTRVKRVNQYA